MNQPLTKLRPLVGATFAVLLSAAALPGSLPSKQVMTVKGAVMPHELGSVLPHEHILVDFGGAATAGPHRYDFEEVYDFALPHLLKAKEAGVQTLIECTPAYIGRDVRLFRKLSDATGLNIITNTGYYGAGKDRFIPEHAYSESAKQIAKRWIDEWTNGIDGTDIRPGFIKTAFDSGPASEIDLKLFRAAALAHLQTGLTIATHTGGNTEAVETQLAILEEYGISPAAWIWVHAQNVELFEDLLPALEAGAWVSLDGVSESSLQKHLDLTLAARDAGFLPQMMISHDAGWYRIGEPDGSPEKFRPYTTVHEKLIPMLKDAGLTQAEIDQLHQSNPQRAFSVLVRTDADR